MVLQNFVIEVIGKWNAQVTFAPVGTLWFFPGNGVSTDASGGGSGAAASGVTSGVLADAFRRSWLSLSQNEWSESDRTTSFSFNVIQD